MHQTDLATASVAANDPSPDPILELFLFDLNLKVLLSAPALLLPTVLLLPVLLLLTMLVLPLPVPTRPPLAPLNQGYSGRG